MPGVDIKILLERWGNWARCRVGTEYPSVAVGMMACTKWDDPRPICEDTEGEVVDRAVCRLRGYDDLGYRLIVVYYVYRENKSKIAKAMGRDRKYVIGYINRAESFLAGALSSYLQPLKQA